MKRKYSNIKIKCPVCDFENEEGSKFCTNCNVPLVTPKISINKENPNIKKEISNNIEKSNIKRVIKKERLRMNKKQRVVLAISGGVFKREKRRTTERRRGKSTIY